MTLKDTIKELFLEFKQVFAYRELIRNLVLRDLKVRYKRSVLGLIWVMLNPLFIMIVIWMVFSRIFDVPNYAAYVISGLVLWNMFSQSTSVATHSFLSNGNLLRKISVPRLIFPVSSVLSGLINFCFSLVPLALIFLITGTPLNVRGLMLPVCLMEVLLFSIGLALILSTCVVFFHDVTYIYEVALLAWMYFSPIFYPVSILPDSIKRIVGLNPMYHYLTLFRGLLYDGTIEMTLLGSHLLYGFLFALASFVVGLGVYAVKKDRLVFYL